MAWSMRKNAAPASAASIKATIADLSAKSHADRATLADLLATLPDLVTEPGEFARGRAESDRLEHSIREAEDTVALLKPKLREAEEREALAALKEQAVDLDKRTEKLKRKLEERYPAWAEAMGALFEELEANSREWESIGSTLREAGLHHLSKHDAEFRARRNFPAAVWPHFTSLWRTALVVALDGTTRFRGPRHSY